jgi:hypothetical protein
MEGSELQTWGHSFFEPPLRERLKRIVITDDCRVARARVLLNARAALWT